MKPLKFQASWIGGADTHSPSGSMYGPMSGSMDDRECNIGTAKLYRCKIQLYLDPICPWHPGSRETIRRQPANLSHEFPTPPRISPGCPHCVTGSVSGAVARQEYHCLLQRSSQNDRCYLPFEARHYRSPFRGHGASLRMLAPELKFLMNVYSLFKVQFVILRGHRLS